MRALGFSTPSSRRDTTAWEPRYQLAAIHAIRGKKDGAYEWLEQAIDAGWRWHRIGVRDPLLANLRHDERFHRMMDDVKAQVDSMRALVEQR